jgi:hypothetical protein
MMNFCSAILVSLGGAVVGVDPSDRILCFSRGLATHDFAIHARG